MYIIDYYKHVDYIHHEDYEKKEERYYFGTISMSDYNYLSSESATIRILSFSTTTS